MLRTQKPEIVIAKTSIEIPHTQSAGQLQAWVERNFKKFGSGYQCAQGIVDRCQRGKHSRVDHWHMDNESITPRPEYEGMLIGARPQGTMININERIGLLEEGVIYLLSRHVIHKSPVMKKDCGRQFTRVVVKDYRDTMERLRDKIVNIQSYDTSCNSWYTSGYAEQMKAMDAEIKGKKST